MTLIDRIKEVLFAIKQQVKALQNDTYIVVEASASNSSNAADVTLITGPQILPNQIFVFELVGQFTTSADTTGIRVAVNGLGTCTLGGYMKASVTSAAAASEVAKMISETSPFILTTNATGGAGFVEAKFLIKNTGAVSFTPTIGFRSEINGSSVQMQSTLLKYRQL